MEKIEILENAMEEFPKALEYWINNNAYKNFDNLYTENVLPCFSMRLLWEYLQQHEASIRGTIVYIDYFSRYYKKDININSVDSSTISEQESMQFNKVVKNNIEKFLKINTSLIDLVSDYWLSSQFQVKDREFMGPIKGWIKNGKEVVFCDIPPILSGGEYICLAKHFAIDLQQKFLYDLYDFKIVEKWQQISTMLCLLHKKNRLTESAYSNYVNALLDPISVYTKDIEKGVRADNPDSSRLENGKIITMVISNIPYVSSQAIWSKCKKHFPIHLLGKHIFMLCKNTLIMNQEFVFPSQNLMLATSKIIVQKNTSISVSGINGANANSVPKPPKTEWVRGGEIGLTGDPGENGQDATKSGNIFLLADEIETNGYQFKLLANGGNGGNGQPGGTGSRGGDGGIGRDAESRGQTLWYRDIEYIPGQPGIKGGKGGRGGRGGDGGHGSKAGTVQAFILVGTVIIETNNGKFGNAGSGGVGGVGGVGGFSGMPLPVGIGSPSVPPARRRLKLIKYNESEIRESIWRHILHEEKKFCHAQNGDKGGDGNTHETLLNPLTLLPKSVFYKEVVSFLLLNDSKLKDSKSRFVSEQNTYLIKVLQIAPVDIWFDFLCTLSEFEQGYLVSLLQVKNEIISQNYQIEAVDILKQKTVKCRKALRILWEMYGMAEQTLLKRTKKLEQNDMRFLSQMLHIKIVNLQGFITGKQGLSGRVANLEALNESIHTKIESSDKMRKEAWKRLFLESYQNALDKRIENGKATLKSLSVDLKMYINNAIESFRKSFHSVIAESAKMDQEKKILELQKREMEANFSNAMFTHVMQSLLNYIGVGIDIYSSGKSIYDSNGNRLKELFDVRNSMLDFKSQIMLENRQFALDEKEFYAEFRSNLIQNDASSWDKIGSRLKKEYGENQKIQIPEEKIDTLLHLEKEYLTHPENGETNYKKLVAIYNDTPEIKAAAADIGKSYLSYLENQKLMENTDNLKKKIVCLENGKSSAIASAVTKNIVNITKDGVQIYQFINSCIKFSDNYKNEISILEQCIQSTKEILEQLKTFGKELLEFQKIGIAQPLEEWLNRKNDNKDVITFYEEVYKFKSRLIEIKKFNVKIMENKLLSNIVNTQEIRSFLDDIQNYLDAEIAITERLADMQDKKSDSVLLSNVLQAEQLGWSDEKIACVNAFIITQLQYMVNLQYQYAGMLTFPLWIDSNHETDINTFQLQIGNKDGHPLSSIEKSAILLESIKIENDRIGEWLNTERQYITPRDGICISKEFINNDYFARVELHQNEDLLYSFASGEEIIVQLQPKWLDNPELGISAVKYATIYAYIPALIGSVESKDQVVKLEWVGDAYYYLITDNGDSVTKYRFPQAPVSLFHSLNLDICPGENENCVKYNAESMINKKQAKCIINSPYSTVRIGIKHQNGFSVQKKFNWNKISNSMAERLYDLFPEIREKGCNFETYFEQDLMDAGWLKSSENRKLIPMQWSLLNTSELDMKYSKQQEQILKEMLLEQMLICDKAKLKDFHIDFIGYGTYLSSEKDSVKNWNLSHYQSCLMP